MYIPAYPDSDDAILLLRTRHREGVEGRVLQDPLHCRPGWASSFRLLLGSDVAASGSGVFTEPWRDKGPSSSFMYYTI